MFWLRIIGYAAIFLVSAVSVGLTAAEVYNSRALQHSNENQRGSNETEKKRRQCGICLKRMNPSEEVTLPCNHAFCRECMGHLLSGTQTTCCDCRKEIPPDFLDHWKVRLL